MMIGTSAFGQVEVTGTSCLIEEKTTRTITTTTKRKKSR